jgi:hypothetical protein
MYLRKFDTRNVGFLLDAAKPGGFSRLLPGAFLQQLVFKCLAFQF